MDVFYEQLFKRCKQPVDYMIQALIFLGCVALSGVAYMLLSFILFPNFLGRVLGIFAIIGIVYVGYKQFMRFNREFEYSYIKGEFDVYFIYTKSERKRMITFKVRDFEAFGEYSSDIKERYKNQKFDKRFDFSSHSKISENKVCFAVLGHRTFGKVFMIFEPDDRILTDMQKYCRLGTGL